MRIISAVWLTFFFMTADFLTGQTVTILYTNNNNGNINYCDCGDEPKGGLARRKTLFDRIRNKEKYVLTVDAGDVLNAFGFNRNQDSVALILYKKLDYDAVNIGEQEFSNGFEFYFKRVRTSGLPLVTSTLFYRDSLLARPYILKSVNGVRFGITGYTPAESFRYLPNKHLLPVIVPSAKEHLKKTIGEIRSLSDIVIVLSQAGYEEDIQLAKTIQGIGIIIGGHTQMEVNENFKIGNTIISQAGGNGEWVGKLTVNIKNGQIQSFDNKLIPLDLKIGEDAAIKNIIRQFEKNK